LKDKAPPLGAFRLEHLNMAGKKIKDENIGGEEGSNQPWPY